ncbi:hypothetical protein GCM10010469_46430 [Streptomyces labedae]|uniref:Uncharacterized protein n=1 Tax=Streptomyces labedae TaxID=285569 RepID=A0ABP6R186_9ACTN
MQQAGRSERGAVAGDREQVHGVRVVDVVLDVHGDALLGDEDLLADAEAGLAVGGVLRHPHRDGRAHA